MKELIIPVSSLQEMQYAIARVSAAIGKGLERAPVEVALRHREDKRSLQANRLMWKLLNDISRQIEWCGQYHDPETWKDLITALMKKQTLLPGLDGGFVAIGTSTRKMRKILHGKRPSAASEAWVLRPFHRMDESGGGVVRYGSVCSGIEAASVAWEPLGMKAAWFSEIEAFPSAVLAHHWPDVKNLGDMTKISRRVLLGEIEAPDVLVGGTPCQAFSVAGMREGMADERGQLTMKYVELANAIDTVRVRAGNPETVIVWENVPGVLSDKQNAFGCFLGALAGEDRELQPSGKKWTNAGCVYGPQRAVAWRVLDAQYFGVAQRRRRVFVVASARADIDPAAVLFEPASQSNDLEGIVKKARGYTSLTTRTAGSNNCRGITIAEKDGRVRRLMPSEEERRQGFQPGHTAVTYRNKPAADGPRYKAIGNSMAVPCMAFIGSRLTALMGVRHAAN